MARYVTSGGKWLTAKDLVGDGGQRAAVFSVDESDDIAIKVFLDVNLRLHHRLKEMMAHEAALAWAMDQSVGWRAAWPIDVVRTTSDGKIVGYVMPLMNDCKSLFDVAEPDGATGTHANFNWQTLLNACFHLAETVRGFNDMGVIIGDLSPHNILVSASGIATIIDCDSVGFTSAGSPAKQWPAMHMTDDFSAPERLLHPSQPATVASDRFSLALVISQALMCNVSPFRATAEQVSTRGSLIENLKAGSPPLFGGSNTAERGCLACLPAPVEVLTRQALSESATNEADRPGPEEWVAALCEADISAQACPRDPWHAYCAPDTVCPFCGPGPVSGVAPRPVEQAPAPQPSMPEDRPATTWDAARAAVVLAAVAADIALVAVGAIVASGVWRVLAVVTGVTLLVLLACFVWADDQDPAPSWSGSVLVAWTLGQVLTFGTLAHILLA